MISAISKGRLPTRLEIIGTPGVVTFEEGIFDMCNRCWEREPQSRPSLTEVIRKLCTYLHPTIEMLGLTTAHQVVSLYITLLQMEQNEELAGESESLTVFETEQIASIASITDEAPVEEIAEFLEEHTGGINGAISDWKAEYSMKTDRTSDGFALTQAVDSENVE